MNRVVLIIINVNDAPFIGKTVWRHSQVLVDLLFMCRFIDCYSEECYFVNSKYLNTVDIRALRFYIWYVVTINVSLY